MKRLNPDILIGILIASLFWVGVFVWQSSQPPNYGRAQGQSCESSKSECAKTTVDERIANYTWWLAVLTGGLVFAGVTQFGFLIRSDNRARIAANAAKKAADAIQIVERPYIFIWGIKGSSRPATFIPADGEVPAQFIQAEACFTYAISNRGKLAAVIESVEIACGYEYQGKPPPKRAMGDHELLQTPIISSNEDRKGLSHCHPWNEMDPTGPPPGFRDGLIFRVVISYRGPFTEGHKTFQRWRYSSSRNAFAEIPDAKNT